LGWIDKAAHWEAVEQESGRRGLLPANAAVAHCEDISAWQKAISGCNSIVVARQFLYYTITTSIEYL